MVAWTVRPAPGTTLATATWPAGCVLVAGLGGPKTVGVFAGGREFLLVLAAELTFGGRDTCGGEVGVTGLLLRG